MKLLLLTCGLAAFACTGLEAQRVSLNPAADTFVSALNSDANYGGAGALEVSGAGTMQGAFDSLLRFDLAPARANFDAYFGPGVWSIQSITLKLTTSLPVNPVFNSNAAGNFSIQWLQNDSWIVGDGKPKSDNTVSGAITYNTLLGIRGASDETLGTYHFGGGTDGDNKWILALTSLFTADVAAGNSVSLFMFAAPGDTTVSYLSNSRSFTTSTDWPLLTIIAVPEPGLAGLWLGGLLVLTSLRPRPRRHASAVGRR